MATATLNPLFDEILSRFTDGIPRNTCAGPIDLEMNYKIDLGEAGEHTFCVFYTTGTNGHRWRATAIYFKDQAIPAWLQNELLDQLTYDAHFQSACDAGYQD